MRDEGHPVVENAAPAKSTREVDDGIFKKEINIPPKQHKLF